MAGGAQDLFDFLNDVWDLLPEVDRIRFGELWKSYEQTYGDIWMQLIDSGLASSIEYLPLYNTYRWRKHLFDSTTQVKRAATFTGNQDLSLGIDLTTRFLLNISVDGGAPIEVSLKGFDPNPVSVKLVEIVDRINAAFGYSLASIYNLALLKLTSRTTGVTSSIRILPASTLSADAAPLVLGLDAGSLPVTFPEFPYTYQLAEPLLVSIPVLQNKIHEEKITIQLTENVDYKIEFGSGIILFSSAPPAAMWAKDNFLNLETPYNNFGYLMDIYDKNTENYLKAVKGLWYAFWTGPRPENIRRSLYLLFGLPTASKPGSITEITGTTISLTYTDTTTETFSIPSGLNVIVSVGEMVTRFQPLVDGIVVYDKVNSPGFVEREVGRYGIQFFLTEKATRGDGPDTDETKALKLLEQNTYLPQIDVNAFISPDIKLGNVRTILQTIQPKSRTFLYQILVGTFEELLTFLERIGQDISLSVDPNLDYNPSLEISQADREDTETNNNTGNILDSESFTMTDSLGIDVYHAALMVDSFTVEG